MQWDPDQYTRYADQRGRPFFDLVAQIKAEAPARVVDLGCGPGDLTITLARRWPSAHVEGIDSSPEMIAGAPADAGVSFTVGIAQDFQASNVDVLVSNAALQWVPEHRTLLAQWAAQLNPGGWMAIQVPANFDAPSHLLMREVARRPRWREQLHGVLRGGNSVAQPAEYLDLLATQGLHADVWQTEYQHLLAGADPVLEWVRGTGLRPVLAALSSAEAAEFIADYAPLLREAYPARDYGTVFGFLRTFAVARKPG